MLYHKYFELLPRIHYNVIENDFLEYIIEIIWGAASDHNDGEIC